MYTAPSVQHVRGRSNWQHLSQPYQTCTISCRLYNCCCIATTTSIAATKDKTPSDLCDINTRSDQYCSQCSKRRVQTRPSAIWRGVINREHYWLSSAGPRPDREIDRPDITAVPKPMPETPKTSIRSCIVNARRVQFYYMPRVACTIQHWN